MCCPYTLRAVDGRLSLKGQVTALRACGGTRKSAPRCQSRVRLSGTIRRGGAPKELHGQHMGLDPGALVHAQPRAQEHQPGVLAITRSRVLRYENSR